MKRTGFEYKIYGQVVFTGKELWLIKQCSDSHYDFHCQTVFAEEPAPPHKNFGTVWIRADLLWQAYRRRKAAGEDIEYDEKLKFEDCLEEVVEIKVSTDQLDTCMKILEPINRGVLKEQADRRACGELSDDIRKVFHELQEEWHLKNYGIGYKLTDDFRWHAVRTAETQYWHDLETPRVRELAEDFLKDDPELVDNLLVALQRREHGQDIPRER
jgi:hypothetical protein